MTPAGHCYRSAGCLSAGHTGPEQHSPSLFHQPALPKVPWGTLKAAASHFCSYSINKLPRRQSRTQGSQIHCVPLILASHSPAAELWQWDSTAHGPRFPQSYRQSRLPRGFDEPLWTRRALQASSSWPSQSLRAVPRREGSRHQQRQGPPSVFSCQDIPFPFYTSGGWDPKEQEQSCRTPGLAEEP